MKISKPMDKEQGFTLVELLVVILIIGILSAIAIPAYLNQRKNAADASLKADIRNMATSMQTYYVKNKFSSDSDRAKSGWSVVARGDDTARFELDLWIAAGAAKATTTPTNFPVPNISPGNAIGVVTGTFHNSKSELGTFCILGFGQGSNYELPDTTADPWKYGMFFDSVEGKFMERSTISPTGACANYR